MTSKSRIFVWNRFPRFPGQPGNRRTRDDRSRAGGQADPPREAELHDIEGSPDAAGNHAHPVCISSKAFY